MSESKLYLIGTPLGNRADITLRALELLKQLSVFFAEDTRELKKLLDLHGISLQGKRFYSLAQHNMKESTQRAVECLGEGNDVGFVSDRGTPGISDPGAMLVAEAHAAGHASVPIPGPSSVTAALSVCGYDARSFLFLGFLSRQPKERSELWDKVAEWGWLACFFESPHRIRDSLSEVAARFPNGEVFIAREMTKFHEQYQKILLTGFKPEDIVDKGEFVIVLHPGPAVEKTGAHWEDEVRVRCLPDKAWAKVVADKTGVSASTIYNALQKERPNKM